MAVAVMFAVTVPAAATAAAPYCGITWGSTTKATPATRAGNGTMFRAGRHPCFDRFVIDSSMPGGDGYHVSYVDEVRRDGTGAVVPLRGGAKMRIVELKPPGSAAVGVASSPYHPDELINVTGWQTFRQLSWAGYDAQHQPIVGLGVRARLPFRVLVLDGHFGGTRIVVDVAHSW